ncbi:MAG: catalase family protein [Lysobacterales bacterium]
MIKKILKISLKLFFIFFIPVYMAYHYVAERIYQANLPMGEVIGLDENAVMANAIAMATDMINKTRNDLTNEGIIAGDATQAGTGYDDLFGRPKPPETTGGRGGPVTYRRDVHIKSHGCVQAEFTVPELGNTYSWGVLSKPGTYKAWIRYSNGDYILKPDKKRDARGMAIKLMGVDGEKLLPGQEKARTQDFVMMNATNYFIRHVEDYVELTKYLAVGDNLGYFLNGYSLNPFSWRFRELRLVAGTKKRPPETPLNTQYFSASAYKLGPSNIKFSAKPGQCLDANGQPEEHKRGYWETDKDDYNFLRLRMSEQLEAGPACFDFMVQMQVPGKIMPVEDATIAWSEDDSPFVKVAEIRIPRISEQPATGTERVQPPFDTEANRQFCENLSFNPWHSLPEHRPVGVFNRVRKALYQEIAKYRWDANRRQYDDPSAPALMKDQPREPQPWTDSRAMPKN